MENNRNFFITIALSILILTVWQVFYMNPRIERQREATRIEQERTAQQDQSVASPGGSTREGMNVLDADERLVKLLTDVLEAARDRNGELARLVDA